MISFPLARFLGPIPHLTVHRGKVDLSEDQAAKLALDVLAALPARERARVLAEIAALYGPTP